MDGSNLTRILRSTRLCSTLLDSLDSTLLCFVAPASPGRALPAPRERKKTPRDGRRLSRSVGPPASATNCRHRHHHHQRRRQLHHQIANVPYHQPTTGWSHCPPPPPILAASAYSPHTAIEKILLPSVRACGSGKMEGTAGWTEQRRKSPLLPAYPSSHDANPVTSTAETSHLTVSRGPPPPRIHQHINTSPTAVASNSRQHHVPTANTSRQHHQQQCQH